MGAEGARPTKRIYSCRICREQVILTAQDVVVARRQVKVPTYRGLGLELMDGEIVLFHGDCWPGESKHYRLTDEDPEA